jgi:hypothetical protein
MYPEIFIDKGVQKKLLAKDESISIKYLETNIQELNFEKIEKEL